MSAWEDPAEYRGGSGGGVQLTFPPLLPMCKLLLIVNVAVFFAIWLLGLFAPGAERGLVDTLGVGTELWFSGPVYLPIWQLFTSQFLHADGMHLAGNMLGLYFLGGMLEASIGSRRFMVLYQSGAVFSSAFSLVMKFALGNPLPSIGASGAVFAVIVAVAVLHPQRRIILFIFPLTLRVFAIGYVALNLLGAIPAIAGRGGSLSDYFAHLGGAAYGYAAVKLGWVWRDPIARLEARQAVRGEERKIDDQRKLDELLNRIHKEGMTSLSAREKAFLKRVSKRS